jgi:hypothetical protein
MDIDRITDLLVDMGMGVGSVAFVCYLSTLHQKPTLELVTDGFMVCYTPFLGLYVHKKDGLVICSQMNGDLSEDHPIEDQLMANELFDYMIEELLAA